MENYDLIKKSIIQAKERINQGLLANQSMLVYELQQKSFEDFEYNAEINLENIKDYNYQDQVIDYLKNNNLIAKNRKKLTQEIFENHQEEITDYLNQETELRSEMQEYYEAWLVDSWLLHKLEQKGQLILDYKGQEQWWGRGCAGQSVSMDYTIQEITKEIAADYANVTTAKIDRYLKLEQTQTFNLY